MTFRDLSFPIFLCARPVHHLLPCYHAAESHSSDVALWSWMPQNSEPNKHLLCITCPALGILFWWQEIDQSSELRTPDHEGDTIYILMTDNGSRSLKNCPSSKLNHRVCQLLSHVIMVSLWFQALLGRLSVASRQTYPH